MPELERAVQIFAIIHLAIMGLSHMLAPRAWAEFFVGLRERGHAGVFAVGFMSLFFGSIIAAFHPVWNGIPVVLTVLGWLQVIKALVYFTFPAYGLRKMGVVSVERANMFIAPGVALLVVAGLLGYHLAG